MSSTRAAPKVAQLPMPGMPVLVYGHTVASCWSVTPGQEVLYLGNISGGPRHGARGVVKQALRHKAVVDLGRSGTWNVPYWFLAVPEAA